MRATLRSWLSALISFRYMLEAGLLGLFLIQALRLLIPALYARIASASIYPVIDPLLVGDGLRGLIAPEVVSGEISLLVYLLAVPLLVLLIGRLRGVLLVAAILVAGGRLLMVPDLNLLPGLSQTTAAIITLGGSLVYIAQLVRFRARVLPYLFIYGFAADQILRAVGNTLDPSLSPTYTRVQIALTGLAVLLAVVNYFVRNAADRTQERHLMPIWGGIGLGSLLYLELALLALPNAIAGRADTDYTLLVPFVLAATLLPLVPQVREWVRGFIGLFDAGVRGWAWMLLVALLIVFGTRFGGLPGGLALVLAQFCVSMMWWWLVRPQAERERNVSSLWLSFSVLFLALFVVFDLFTYEYAYVRDFAAPLRFLNPFVPPLLRGFRGLGLAVLLLGVFLAALPLIQSRRLRPWQPVTGRLQSLVAGLVIAAAAGGAAYAARPVVVTAVRDVPSLRIATYNLHAGYSEFFAYDLEQIAQTIARSGADIVLLQEVEAGRLTSYGVDQPLWLARRLAELGAGMDRRFYATNEGLQGLAVLSRVPIVFDDGTLLTSFGSQTGVQRVQVQPDQGVITIYNTWLGVLTDTTGTPLEAQEQDQQRQLGELLSLVALHHVDSGGVLGRTVIGGTFNNVPDSDLIRQMVDLRFDDPFAGQPALLSDTFWQLTRRARLDYLWLRNLPHTGGLVVDSDASDHRLAVVEVNISR